MDKISLLQVRKQQILAAGKDIRKDIDSLIDKDSFVELSAYSFSKNEFYGEEAEGEGVVTGFATIEDYPFYIIAQNSAVFSGGISKANCEKIVKCLAQAEKSSTPVIYLLSSKGVQIGEGINVLEGLASLILKASQLKGTIPQFLIVNGEVYGQVATLAGICDFTFFIEQSSILAPASPLVISAQSGVNKPKAEIGGSKGLSRANLVSFEVKNFEEIKNYIQKINGILSTPVVDCDDLNTVIQQLDKKADIKDLLSVFDSETIVEAGSSYSNEVKCILARVGGIAVAAVIFDSLSEGVKLNVNSVRKIKDFAEFACCYNLPYITFVNSAGIRQDIETNNSLVLRELGKYVSILDCINSAKISVVYGKAIGLGYTFFAAKSMGYDYSYAFANAKIALFDDVQGAEIEFSNENADKDKLAERYAEENSDPINAAKGGYIDNIIQPSFIKQYLIASLQMLLK